MASTPRPIDTGASDAPVLTSQVGGPSPAAEMSQGIGAYAELSDFGKQLGDLGDKMLQPEMEAKGSQAVTRDPATGELSVQLRTPLNDLDVAYNHAAQAAFGAQSESDRRLYLQKLAIDNADDPAAFKDLATKYVKTQAGGVGVPPALRGDILNTGLADVTQFTAGLVQKKHTDDTREQLGAIKSGADSTKNDILALAHNGGTDTPDFAAAAAKYKNQLGLLRNPLFGISQQKIDDEYNETVSSAEGEAALGHALATAKAGGMQAGMEFLDKAIWDPKLNLSPAQRQSFVSQGHREIAEWDAAQRGAAVELKQQVANRLDDASAKAEATGEWQSVVTPDEIARAYASDPAKGADIISALNGQAMTYSMRKQVATATPADLAAMEARYNPAKGKVPAQGFDAFYSGFLASHEGGFTASDGNGSPANFGVNQGANPDLDVASLTQDQAKAVLKDRYWLASGADQLPPDLAAVQGDTAINMGVGTAKELLAQSGGDAQKYLQLREAKYRSIAAANPDKAADLPAWLQRNEDLRNFATGGSFADQEKTYRAFLKAVQERGQALTKDPAAFAAQGRPDVVGMLQSDNPTIFQQGVRGLLQTQRDMGVNAPRILTDGQSTGIVQQFNNPTEPDKRADGMNQIIDGLAQRYGDYFPQVMQELQKKGMPPEASSLYAVRGLGVPAARMATAINSMSHMGKDLNSGRDAFFVGAPNNAEIRKALPGVMGDYGASFVGNPDGPQQTAAMANAVSLYARQIAYEGVNDPNQAAQRAHDDLIGSRYNFVDGYRVPKGIDQAMIQQGANLVRSALSGPSLEPYGAAPPGVSIDDRRTMSARILSKQGVWSTSSDDRGLQLLWPQATGFLPAKDAKGRPIFLSWSSLQHAGQHRGTADAFSTALESGAGGN